MSLAIVHSALLWWVPLNRMTRLESPKPKSHFLSLTVQNKLLNIMKPHNVNIQDIIISNLVLVYIMAQGSAAMPHSPVAMWH